MSEQTIWNWKKYFNNENLKCGRADVDNGRIVSFECDPAGVWAMCDTAGGFTAKVLHAPTSYDELTRYPDWRYLHGGINASGKNAFTRYYHCTCAQGSMGTRCRHLASLMFKWEDFHGPFVMEESEEARAERLKKARDLEQVLLLKKRREEEIKRKQENTFPVIQYLLPRLTKAPDDLFFNPDSILKNMKLLTDEYETEIAEQLLPTVGMDDISIELSIQPSRRQTLSANMRCDGQSTNIAIDSDDITGLNCSCGHAHLHYLYWYSDKNREGHMCGHALVLWTRMRERIIRDDPGDETDYNGMQFLTLLGGGSRASDAPESGPSAEAEAKKRQDVLLIPRITRDRNHDTLKLSFDIGRSGGRCYAVKGLENFVKAVEQEEAYAAAKAVTIDFSRETFTDEAAGWYQLALSRVRAVNRVNNRLNASSSYYYNGKLAVGNGIPLEESDLDIVYDMTEGGSIQYQYGARNEVCEVRVGEAVPRAELRLDPIKSGKKLTGIAITGEMPRLLRGSRHQYILDRSCFGRVPEGELDFLSALQAIDNDNGSFRCTIGDKKFAEFYYRVLPSLQGNPQLRVMDNVGSLIEGFVPPEPQFTFYLDLRDGNITCEAFIRYDEASFRLGTTPEGIPSRDIDQEVRVGVAIRGYFPNIDRANQRFCCPMDDDNLFVILTDGVAALSRFGEINGSDAFKRVRVRPAPETRVSVRVDGGLLDLSIKTKDMSEGELLELISSYQLKRRWHRLRSGDYVDLHGAATLDALDETARAMDTSLEALIRGEVQLPKYRALYVDRLLEAHDDIATSRDRVFKGLIRSFQTIRDSDFEAPAALQDVLRPYQLYGFRWLSTLSQAGFGGILADEMGLGKTVQMLSCIQAQRERGEVRPALVVCPASLVYNWREECRKFTPDLRAEAIAGTLKQRRDILKELTADLYITSYDLLKRDIAMYDDLSFSTVVLDEAQYIKNQRAAVSKAVRVLKAEHRFALTGTPIENRLSELWSIFDFLMPGFLYTAAEFGERFEGPIVKQRDGDAATKLSRMTEPFILRRKKTDVLKDLPEKLEEARSSEMEPDQRKLYDAQVVRMKALLDSSGDSGEDKLRILGEITRLREICCDPALIFSDYTGSSAKRAACLELIQNAMDAGHRMLVFSQFTSMLSLLEADLKAAGIPYFVLTGATPKLERIRLVNAFNEGDTPVFLISLKAGGTGLNLTGADVVIHYDPWWNLAVQNQATDRAHRIGQTRQVTVVKLIAADTIEEKIIELQEKKRDLAEAIITGQNTSLMSLSREELMELLG